MLYKVSRIYQLGSFIVVFKGVSDDDLRVHSDPVSIHILEAIQKMIATANVNFSSH